MGSHVADHNPSGIVLGWLFKIPVKPLLLVFLSVQHRSLGKNPSKPGLRKPTGTPETGWDVYS
jgi:hypothetical protein